MYKLQGLYAITDASLTPDDQIMSQVSQAIRGGVRVLQFRDKSRSDTAIYDLVLALQARCREQHVCFILNDRLDLAQQIDADGLHIGAHDMLFAEARAALPGKILGMSCYGNLPDALHYESLGADYVAFGACFNSPTKPQAATISLDLLKSAKARLRIPICAIGGITLSLAPQLTTLGVDMLAVISDLWMADDIESHAARFTRLISPSV